MRCGLTGATGYLGARCAAALRARGHAVVGLVRRPRDADDRAFALGAAVDPSTLADLDALIHCAHDFSVRDPARAWATNAEGGARLMRAAAAAGVRRTVFVSTVAAFEGCASEYGRGKLHVERAARAEGATVLRPGLLWGGDGRGLFSALQRMTASPVLPVFDAGDQPLVLAHVDDVAATVATAVEAPVPWPTDPIALAHPRVWTFAALLRALARSRGRSLRTVSVPSSIALRVLQHTEGAGLALPFRRDSLVSLLHPPALHFEAAVALGLSFRPWTAP